MMHRLKCHPAEFDAVVSGTKVHEFRKNDRHFAVGDLLELGQWDPKTERFTGKWTRRVITYIEKDEAVPVTQTVLVFSEIEEDEQSYASEDDESKES